MPRLGLFLRRLRSFALLPSSRGSVRAGFFVAQGYNRNVWHTVSLPFCASDGRWHSKHMDDTRRYRNVHNPFSCAGGGEERMASRRWRLLLSSGSGNLDARFILITYCTRIMAPNIHTTTSTHRHRVMYDIINPNVDAEPAARVRD